jgi:hypothetical protein
MISFVPLVTTTGEVVGVQPFQVGIVAPMNPPRKDRCLVGLAGQPPLEVFGEDDLVCRYLSGDEKASAEYMAKWVKPAQKEGPRGPILISRDGKVPR